MGFDNFTSLRHGVPGCSCCLPIRFGSSIQGAAAATQCTMASGQPRPEAARGTGMGWCGNIIASHWPKGSEAPGGRLGLESSEDLHQIVNLPGMYHALLTHGRKGKEPAGDGASASASESQEGTGSAASSTWPRLSETVHIALRSASNPPTAPRTLCAVYPR